MSSEIRLVMKMYCDSQINKVKMFVSQGSTYIFLTQNTSFLRRYFYVTFACLCNVLQSVYAVILDYLILLAQVEKSSNLILALHCSIFLSFQSKLDDYQERMNKGERLNQDQLVKRKKKNLTRFQLNCFVILVGKEGMTFTSPFPLVKARFF